MNGSNLFRNGRTSTDDDEWSGQPSTSRFKPLIAQVKNIFHGNRRLTVREVAEGAGIFIGSCHTILMDYLGMHHVSAKFVPRLLTDDQKLKRFSICDQMSLPVMRRGFMVMTWKPNNNPHTGKVLLCLTPRKHNRCARK
jgi:hypothetical protein